VTEPTRTAPASIRIRGARQHNLKNIDLDLPRGGLTVITGVSGSGKSSLAFDTLYAEGQRRYVESVSTYAKQFLDRLPRPDVDAIHGLTPAVAIQQLAPARSARSTVGTATEIHDHLRLLFARLGLVHCGKCGRPVVADSPQRIGADALGWPEGELILVLAPVALTERMSWEDQAGHLLRAGYTRVLVGDEVVELEPLPKLRKAAKSVKVVIDRFRWAVGERERLVDSCEQGFRRGEGRIELRIGARSENRSERWECAHCGTPATRPEPTLFSFNSPAGACPTCRGFGDVLTFSPGLIVPDPDKTLRTGAIDPWARSFRKLVWPRLEKLAKERDVPLDIPWKKMKAEHRTLLIEGDKGFRGAIPFLQRLQAKSYKIGNRFLVKRYQTAVRCHDCGGTRLRPEAHRVTIAGRSIAEVTALAIDDAATWVAGLDFTPAEKTIAGPVLGEVESRLAFLQRVDLGYLTLDRLARTLSGGEAQRIELANALGANLTDTLYVLDEPTIGLHARDSDRLASLLGNLTARGNTLVVVEHEPILMRAADHLVDLGPGAGENGGQVLYAGPAGPALDTVTTDTARYLRGELAITRPRVETPPSRFITIEGATQHNLRDVTARFPLARMTAVTGVSGSGKSSLVQDVLHRVARRVLELREEEPAGAHRAVHGLESLTRVVMVDQSPIGKTPRSCPVTYISAYAPLRAIFAVQPAALARGFKDGAFSFNTAGGRCEACEGAGWVTVEMYFLADLLVPCDTCGGARFKPEVLEVRYRGVNIKETLDMTVDDAFAHYGREPRFTRLLQPLRQVGLGYLKLGQAATQLSGGEAQRLKIARELAERHTSSTLYLLDEPTVGLHYSDVQRLLEVLDDLVRRGDTVILVEHNLDVIRNCDWVVDLGPEGGSGGGELVAEGSPEHVATVERSWTGRFLRAMPVPVAGPATSR
jgi:excinuclease ABC subunit A